jgi:hypothetical protein
MREGAAGLWLGADDRFRGIRAWLLFPFSKNAQGLQKGLSKDRVALTGTILYHIIFPGLGFFVYIRIHPPRADFREHLWTLETSDYQIMRTASGNRPGCRGSFSRLSARLV